MNLLCAFLFLSYGGGFEQALIEGDAAFSAIDYPKAIGIYETALRENPNEPALLWRLSRTYVTLGEDSDGEKKEELFRKAEACARACIHADEKYAQGHTGLAAALGSVALISSNKTKVKLSHEVKRELLRAIELDSTDYVPHSILGSFYREIGGLSWIERQVAGLLFGKVPDGSYDDAEAELRKAIELAPDAMRNHYELALLCNEMDRTQEAIVEFKITASLPVQQASDRERLVKTQHYLKELERR